MANSVDPDQTAWSGSALFANAILSETVVYEILGTYHTIFTLLGHHNFFPNWSFVCLAINGPVNTTKIIRGGRFTSPHFSWAYCAHSFARNWQLPFLNQQKGHTGPKISTSPLYIILLICLITAGWFGMYSQRAHDVNITSPQRRCNVMSLHRRWGDVIFTSCACRVITLVLWRV